MLLLLPAIFDRHLEGAAISQGDNSSASRKSKLRQKHRSNALLSAIAALTMLQVGTAYNAWTSALLLAKYLWLCSSPDPPLPLPLTPVTHRSVLELGCGVGVVGFTAAKLGGRVTMSDFNDDVLHNVVEGLQANGLHAVGEVQVVKLDWGREEGGIDTCSSKLRWYGGDDADGAAFAPLERGVVFDIVLASDCCYEPDHPRLLCRFAPTKYQKRNRFLTSCPSFPLS